MVALSLGPLPRLRDLRFVARARAFCGAYCGVVLDGEKAFSSVLCDSFSPRSTPFGLVLPIRYIGVARRPYHCIGK